MRSEMWREKINGGVKVKERIWFSFSRLFAECLGVVIWAMGNRGEV